jgi:transmembrane sensor
MKIPAPILAEDRTVLPAELDEQAWNWLRLLGSGNADTDDAERFRRWVRSSPAHQAAYDKARRRWDVFKSPAGAVLRADPEMADLYVGAQRRPNLNRRALLGAAVSAVAVAGVAVVYPPLGLWPTVSEWRADYRTARGEQRTLVLADSADITLNTQTSIRRTRDGEGAGNVAGVELVSGEAAIDLKPKATRPFTVTAGPGRSSAQSGRFEVRYLDGKVCVTCIAGAVQIEHPAGLRILQARQQAIYDTDTISGTAGIDPDTVSAWRRGVLVLDQTRLVDAIAEINRYRSGRVVLMNTAMRNKPVSGRFALASLDVALWQIQHVFDLQARSLVGGILVLS